MYKKYYTNYLKKKINKFFVFYVIDLSFSFFKKLEWLLVNKVLDYFFWGNCFKKKIVVIC